MNRWGKAVLLCLLAVCLCCFAASGLADAGNFGGDTDWGGSDWDSSWDTDWDTDWDSDWDSDLAWTAAGSALSLGGLGDWLVPVVVVLIIALALGRNIRKAGRQNGRVLRPRPVAGEPVGLPLSALKEKDPNFSEQALLERVGNLYVQMQEAWQKKDWEPMRGSLSDALFHQMARQLVFTGFSLFAEVQNQL